MAIIGSKLQVWNGVSDHTSGGLTRSHLMKNKRGKIVSKKQHAQGLKAFKNNNLKPLSREELLKIKPK